MVITYLECFDDHQDLHGIHFHHHWTSNRSSFWENLLDQSFHSYERFFKTVVENLPFLKIPHCLIQLPSLKFRKAL